MYRNLVLALCLLPTLAWGASGDQVVTILDVIPPATSGATLVTIAGGSSPNEVYPAWEFPDSGITYLDLKAVLTNYSGGGLTCRVYWATPAASGNAILFMGIRRLTANTEVVTGAQTYTFLNFASTSTSAANTVHTSDSSSWTNGAQIDSWTNGEIAWLRLKRDPANASDTLNNVYRFMSLRCVET